MHDQFAYWNPFEYSMPNVLSKIISFFVISSLAGLGSKYAGLESKPELSDLMNEVASNVSAKWREISIPTRTNS